MYKVQAVSAMFTERVHVVPCMYLFSSGSVLYAEEELIP